MPVTVSVKTNVNLKLSPALKFGGLQDPQLKEMGKIEMALETTLTKLAAGKSKIDPEVLIEKANEYRDSKFAGTHVYLAEREVLTNGKIKVKARIIRDDTEETVATYYAVFTVQKDEDQGFAVDVYTEKEWNENKRVIRESKLLPRRESQYPEDAKAIARYIKHEKNVDSLIKFAHENGYAATPTQKAFDYKQEIKALIEKLGVEVSLEDLESMMNREFFMVEYNDDVEKSDTTTIVDKFGNEHEVFWYAHSSNSAVHVITGASYYDVLIQRPWIDNEEKKDALKYLRERLVHEIGVMLGRPILEVRSNLETNNILDQRWKVLKEDPDATFEKLKLQVVDLDNVRDRDYAMAKGDIGYREVVEEKKTEKNPYWTRVEKGLKESILADNMARVDFANGRLVSALTSKKLEDQRKYRNILNLLYSSKKEIRKWVDVYDGGETQIQRSNFYNALQEEIKQWIYAKYKAITKREDIENIEDVLIENNEVFLRQIAKWFKQVLQAQIYINLGEVYASPITKELTHVKRGVTEKGETGFYFGELFLRKLAEKGEVYGAQKLAILMLDEAMHIGKEMVAHGTIEKAEDIDEKVDHILTLKPGEFPMKEADEAWEESIDDKPWKANLAGGNVGKSDEMIDFFERLKQFAEKDGSGTAMISGPAGSGKDMAVEAVYEMMGLAKEDVGGIDCGRLSGMGKQRQADVLAGLEIRDKKLFIVDNFECIDENLCSLLSFVSEPKRQLKILYLGRSKPPVPMKSKDLYNRIEMFFEMPAFSKRGDDIVRLAEHFNKQASKEHHIAYAPIDHFTGENLKEVIEKAGKITDPISIWDLRKLIYNIVAERALLFKRKKLPEDSPYLYGWRGITREYFSSAVITYADILYLQSFLINNIPNFEKLMEVTEIVVKEKYAAQKNIMPYFEQLAPRDAQGKPIGFYKGLKGEQPGLPEEKVKEEPIKWDKIEEDSKMWWKLYGKEIAKEVGIKIAPPVSNYTLFVANNIATDEDFNRKVTGDKDKYASRFGLERIPTDKSKEIVDSVLTEIKKQNLDPKNVMVQLPKGTGEITKLISNAPGIRFMIIDTKGLKDDGKTTSEEKAQYREIIYSMMLLARYADKDKPNPKLDSFLKYFVDFCFEDVHEKSELMDNYIEALKTEQLVNIVMVILSYKYMTKHILPDRATISAALMSA